MRIVKLASQHEQEEMELHRVALTKDIEQLLDRDVFFDTVSEEDGDQDLERSVLQAKLSYHDQFAWAVKLDSREDNTSLWGVLVAPSFAAARAKLG